MLLIRTGILVLTCFPPCCSLLQGGQWVKRARVTCATLRPGCRGQGGPGHSGGRGASVLPSSSFLKSGGSCNRFARDVGEGGKTPSSEESGFIQRQETTVPFLKCTRERDPKAKGRMTSSDPQRSACFGLWVSQSL